MSFLFRIISLTIISYFLVLPCLRAQNFVFAQLTGTPVNTTGWNLQGAAKVTNITGTGNSEILVCPAIQGTSGAIFYNQPINLSLCNRWKVEFDFRLYDGTAADGLTFCFLDVPPSGFVTGGGLGIPATANGLKVCFDTWNNCLPQSNLNVPKIELRWGIGYGGGECASLPTRDNADGKLSFIRSANYNHAKIEYDNGNINVYVNDSLYLTGYQQFNFSGYLGFTSSTGGSTDNQSIKNVVIYTEMPPSVAGNNVSICPGDSAQIGNAGNAQYVYNWTPAIGLSSLTVPNPKVSLANTSGNVLVQHYFIRTSFASNPGCASVDSVTVTVNPKPLIDFTLPVVCLPQASAGFINKTNILDGTLDKIIYNWTFSDGGISAEINPSHIYSSDGLFTVQLRATSSNGCVDSLTKSLTIQPQAKMSITAENEFCQDSSMQFSGSTNSAVAIDKWYWNFGDSKSDSLQNPIHTFISADSLQVNLYSVTTEGCHSDTAFKQVIINPVPYAGFSYTGSQCINKAISFNDTSKANIGNIISQIWNFNGETEGTGVNVNHTYTIEGEYFVTLTVKNTKGCVSKPITQHVFINPSPVVSFTMPSVCYGNNGIFLDNSTISDQTQNLVSYRWSFGDGIVSSIFNPAHIYASPGSYPVKLKVTSDNGCADSLTKTISISDYPVTDFQILTTDFCGNLPLLLKDNSSVNFAKIDHLKIYWNWPSLEDTSVFYNPVNGQTYSHTYTGFGYVASKQVNAKIEAYSTGGCFTEKSANSILFASPRLEFDDLPQYCNSINENILLTQAKDTSSFTGNGYYYGDGIVNNNFFNPSVAGSGNHLIYYKYTLSNGCADSVSKNIKVGIQPMVNAGPDETILQGGITQLTATVIGGDNLLFTWSPGTGLSNTTISNPSASPAQDTYYTLNVSNSDGCNNSDIVFVKVLKAPVIPNAFSPNHDRINDTWRITYLNSYPDCVVEIFNRYGQLVFHSNGYSTPWDGTYNGKDLPVGTYYYVIDTKRITKLLTGSVTLLR